MTGGVVTSDDADRINRIAEQQASMRAELNALKHRVNAVNGVPVQLARLEGHVHDLQSDVLSLTSSVTAITVTLNDRTKIESQERQAMRRVLVALSGTILAALISAAVVIVTSMH